MAAVPLSPVTEFPTVYKGAAEATWTQHTIDPRTEVVTIDNEDASIVLYVAFDKMGPAASVESPAQGGTVGATSRARVPAGTARAFRVRSLRGDKITGSVYVASASGTPTYTVTQELGPA
jgi:hypothetical protein